MRQIPFLLALGLAAASAQAAEPGPASARAGVNNDPNKIICRTEREIGSRLRATRVCRTRQEWAEYQRETRRAVGRAQEQTQSSSN